MTGHVVVALSCHALSKFRTIILSLQVLNGGLIAQPIESLPPQVVSAESPDANGVSAAGQTSRLDRDRLSTIPPASATYQDLFSSFAGGNAGNPTVGTFSVRGVGQEDTMGSLRMGSNPLIVVFEDGAPLSTNTLRYLPPVLWNVQGVELLRGPQLLTVRLLAGCGASWILDRKSVV